MKIYHYDETGMFLCESDAKLDPIEKKPLLPKQSTAIIVLAEKAGFQRVFNKNTQTWSYIEDNLGEYYNKQTGDKESFAHLGVLPAYLTALPFLEFSQWDDKSQSWLVNSVLANEGIFNEYKNKINSIVDDSYTNHVSLNARYKDKRAEAELYKAASYPEPVPSEYVYLIAESTEENITAREQADIVLSKSKYFKDIGVYVDVRIKRLKKQIVVAETVADKKSVAEVILNEVKLFVGV